MLAHREDAPRLSRLRARHFIVGTRVVFWSLVVRAGLTWPGFRGVRSLLRLKPMQPVEFERARYVPMARGAERDIALALRALELPGLRSSCLPKAIVLGQVARAAGVDADVVIGVDGSEGFRAHAWLEIQGFAVGATETGSSAWQPLGRFRR
jgi:hypothetical protein